MSDILQHSWPHLEVTDAQKAAAMLAAFKPLADCAAAIQASMPEPESCSDCHKPYHLCQCCSRCGKTSELCHHHEDQCPDCCGCNWCETCERFHPDDWEDCLSMEYDRIRNYAKSLGRQLGPWADPRRDRSDE